MCSRYFLTSSPEAVRSAFGHCPAEPFPPRYNIAPSQPVAIVRPSPRGGRELALVRWGLLPGWVKDPAAFAMLFSGRAETAADKASFRGALRYRRCLVPADGYYLWTGEAPDRQPYLARPRAGGPLALAGLWESWLGADGSEIETMAVLTVEANGHLRTLGERMPAILAAGALAAWLDVAGVAPAEALGLLRPAPEGLLEAYPIGRAVGNARLDGPELQVPLSRPEPAGRREDRPAQPSADGGPPPGPGPRGA